MEYEYEFQHITVFDVWEHCVVQSIKAVTPKVTDLLIFNVLFSIITQTERLPSTVFHIISFGWGIILMYSTILITNICHFIVFLLFAYIALYFVYRVRIEKQIDIEYLTGFACILYLLLCEFLHPSVEDWMQSRGLFMIAAMKIISLCFDLQQGIGLPSIIGYLGYMCCPANSLFGPWISYNEYVSVHYIKRKKNFQWILRIIITLITSLFFLTISNCWGAYLIPDSSNKWLLAYQQALSFRSSHYFISYLSEASMVAAGYCDKKNNSKTWGYQIAYPLDVEIPSSLVSVVISWNVPMHKFLKKYVYQTFLPWGYFKAILITYLISALLHGFNIEIATVLLTIGIFSYIQFKFQDKLATEFNACLKVRPCKSCHHKYRRSRILVKFAHVCFCCLTIFNLVYLGVLMDSIDLPDSPSVYNKWEKLDFIGHWVMSGIYIFTIL